MLDEWPCRDRNNRCHFSDGPAWIPTMSIPKSPTSWISIRIGLGIEKWSRDRSSGVLPSPSRASWLNRSLNSSLFNSLDEEYYGPFNALLNDLSLLPSTIRSLLISSVLSALSTSPSYTLSQDEKFSSCLSRLNPPCIRFRLFAQGSGRPDTQDGFSTLRRQLSPSPSSTE